MEQLPTVRTMARRIIKTFTYVTPEGIESGAEWYDRAQRFAVELATQRWGRLPMCTDENEEWEREVDRAAAVIAVLSPRLSWAKNVELAYLVYSLVKHRTWTADLTVEEVKKGWGHGLTDGPSKAFRMLVLGEEPDDVVSGPKVRQFWLSIVDPSDPRTLVVDRHAFDVAVNQVLTDAVRGKLLGRKGAYDDVSKAYRDATRQINKLGLAGRTLTPAQVQAIVWEWWRANRAAANHGKTDHR